MFEESELDWQYELLRTAIARLSWDAARQVEYLRGLGLVVADDEDVIDELVLEFDDARGLVAGLVGAGRLSRNQASAIEALERVVESMQREGIKIWELKALREHERWTELRSAARECVRVLG